MLDKLYTISFQNHGIIGKLLFSRRSKIWENTNKLIIYLKVNLHFQIDSTLRVSNIYKCEKKQNQYCFILRETFNNKYVAKYDLTKLKL